MYKALRIDRLWFSNLHVYPTLAAGSLTKRPKHTTIKGEPMKIIRAKLPSVALVFLATWLLLILPNLG